MTQDENPLHILLAGLTTPLCWVLFSEVGVLFWDNTLPNTIPDTYSDMFHHTSPAANDVVLFMFQ